MRSYFTHAQAMVSSLRSAAIYSTWPTQRVSGVADGAFAFPFAALPLTWDEADE
ncbi:MAG: hypothetical protein ABI690_15075 [Chloroflexota bacterium]